MGKEWTDRGPSSKVVSQAAADNVGGGVDLTSGFEGLGQISLPKPGKRARVLLAGASVVSGLVGCAPGKNTETPTQTPKPIETLTKTPTKIPPSPTIVIESPTATSTLTPEPTPTSDFKIEIAGVSEIGEGENDILRHFDIQELGILKDLVEEKNEGVRMLTTDERIKVQYVLRFSLNKEIKLVGNWNMPVYPAGEGSVIFNNPETDKIDCQNLFCLEDKNGNLFFYSPLQGLRIWEEGRVPIVIIDKDGVLKTGMVAVEDGTIDPTSIKDYWQEMPEGAVEAVMSLFKAVQGNTVKKAIYVTFWDNKGKKLEAETITVFEFPDEILPEPTPSATLRASATPAPTGTPTKKPTERPTETPRPPEVQIPFLPPLPRQTAESILQQIEWSFLQNATAEGVSYDSVKGRFLGFRIDGGDIVVSVDCDKGQGGEHDLRLANIEGKNVQVRRQRDILGIENFYSTRDGFSAVKAILEQWYVPGDPILVTIFKSGSYKGMDVLMVIWRESGQ